MKSTYEVVLESGPVSVEVAETQPGTFEVAIADQVLSLDVRELGHRSYHVIAQSDGAPRCVDAVVNGTAPQLSIHRRGAATQVTLLDERTAARSSGRGQSCARDASGLARVMAPMPGKVVKCLVAVGAEVVEGQGAVVIEAMKMENELRTPAAGVVRKIHVVEGENVEGGACLVSIE